MCRILLSSFAFPNTVWPSAISYPQDQPKRRYINYNNLSFWKYQPQKGFERKIIIIKHDFGADKIKFSQR